MSNALRAQSIVDSLSKLPVDARDAAFEALAGIADDGRFTKEAAPPGPSLIGYHASSVAAVLRTLWEVPLGGADVFVDLGAGLGKTVLLAALLTPARARGIEVQTPLATAARDAAKRLGVAVEITNADVRDAPLADGTLFYLYAPFTGDVLANVLLRLRAVAEDHDIVVAALGVDLARLAPWLAPRSVDSFWLTLYDSGFPGARPRSGATTGRTLTSPAAFAVAFAQPPPRETR